MFIMKTPIPDFIEILQEFSALEHAYVQTLPPHYAYILHTLYKESVGMHAMINVRIFNVSIRL
jgi:hypothetical protein